MKSKKPESVHHLSTRALITILTSLLLLFSITGCRKDNGVDDSLQQTSVFKMNNVDNILFTYDNGFLITGSNEDHYLVIKTNQFLDPELSRHDFSWATLVRGKGWGSSFYSIGINNSFQREDGSFVCIGSISEGGDILFYSTLVVLLDSHLNQQKVLTYDGTSITNAFRTSDGGYLLFGTKIIKLDANLNELWQKIPENNGFNEYKITTTSDGGFATTGTIDSETVLLKKYDANGNLVFSNSLKTSENSFEEAGFDIAQMADNGFLIVGRSGKTFVPNIVQCEYLRTDQSGNLKWSKRIPFSGNSWLEKIVSQKEDEYIILGSIGFPNETQRSFLLKINNDGQVLDSATVSKFNSLYYSPRDYFFKVKNSDESTILLTRIKPAELFVSKN